ncbi:hypothetical protein HV205_12895 [Klebsiella sp. RHBSTW-00465]|nr:hypothetical protein [Klebsiella sp. RHBSTW-00465]
MDGGSGNDQLAGGAGNDVLKGGYGSDSYLFNTGDGQDTISEGSSSLGDSDTLRFGEGITAENAIVQRSGDDLLIGLKGSADSVRVAKYFSSARYQVEHIAFADGTDWLVQDILNHTEDNIPLPMLQPATTPVSQQRVREQMALFVANDEGDDDCALNMAPSLSTSRSSVNSLMGM